MLLMDLKESKEAGKFKVEGKEYIVKDGDVRTSVLTCNRNKKYIRGDL
jgi:ribosome-binding ATPase YchF (GTP1/OBG family)